jgi:hypothetical protein
MCVCCRKILEKLMFCNKKKEGMGLKGKGDSISGGVAGQDRIGHERVRQL